MQQSMDADSVDTLGFFVFASACRGVPWIGLYRCAGGEVAALAWALASARRIDPADWNRPTPLADVIANLTEAVESAGHLAGARPTRSRRFLAHLGR